MIKSFFKLLFYFLGFIIVGAIAGFVIFKLLSFNRTVDAPSLIGKSVLEATKLLNKKGLSLDIKGEDYDSEIPKGYIMRQDIKPGEKVKIGTSIKVFLSKGPEIFSMPSFEGQLLEDAKLTLSNLGIEIGRITWVHSDTVEKGRIIAQRPLPGNVEGNKINFLVSLGHYEVSYRCPSFVDMTIDDARELAETLGLELIEQGEGSRIIFQKPEAGAVVKKGDSVEVTLGRGWGFWF